MDLRSILSQPQFVSLSDADALTALAADVAKTDSTAYTWSGLGLKLTANGMAPTDVATIDSWIEALPGGSMLGRMLDSGGVDFTLATIRGQLSAVRAGLDSAGQAKIDALLAVGQWTVPYWQDQGIPTSDFANNAAPQLSDIAAARAWLALNAKWATVAGTIAAGIEAGAYANWATVQQYIAGVN